MKKGYPLYDGRRAVFGALISVDASLPTSVRSVREFAMVNAHPSCPTDSQTSRRAGGRGTQDSGIPITITPPGFHSPSTIDSVRLQYYASAMSLVQPDLSPSRSQSAVNRKVIVLYCLFSRHPFARAHLLHARPLLLSSSLHSSLHSSLPSSSLPSLLPSQLFLSSLTILTLTSPAQPNPTPSFAILYFSPPHAISISSDPPIGHPTALTLASLPPSSSVLRPRPIVHRPSPTAQDHPSPSGTRLLRVFHAASIILSPWNRMIRRPDERLP
jgi:hypothetical protein